MKKKGNYYEVVYTWPGGREEVRYRRPVTDLKLAREVAVTKRAARKVNQRSPYSIRRVLQN